MVIVVVMVAAAGWCCESLRCTHCVWWVCPCADVCVCVAVSRLCKGSVPACRPRNQTPNAPRKAPPLQPAWCPSTPPTRPGSPARWPPVTLAPSTPSCAPAPRACRTSETKSRSTFSPPPPKPRLPRLPPPTPCGPRPTARTRACPAPLAPGRQPHPPPSPSPTPHPHRQTRTRTRTRTRTPAQRPRVTTTTAAAPGRLNHRRPCQLEGRTAVGTSAVACTRHAGVWGRGHHRRETRV